eukprot:TRINITY_DN7681_c0_g2_i3.p1 TRINITY_DN7681_c0_g2~~TRINITY_DN7681_c0_g2_i3.p1  ORF type:complete len:316 (-),score=29.63 TRINITY_DN7681_c0_g2_i3:444-1391(-)
MKESIFEVNKFSNDTTTKSCSRVSCSFTTLVTSSTKVVFACMQNNSLIQNRIFRIQKAGEVICHSHFNCACSISLNISQVSYMSFCVGWTSMLFLEWIKVTPGCFTIIIKGPFSMNVEAVFLIWSGSDQNSINDKFIIPTLFLLGHISGACSTQASCIFDGIGEGHVLGNIMLYQKPGENLIIDGVLIGATPNQKHGFHIHAEGSLDDNCKAAGGHFNPFQKKHGGPTDAERHVGDLGNVQADGTGTIEVRMTDDLASLLDSEYSILNKAIVLHAGEDDLGRGGNEGSEATGNAGARLGCCIITELVDLKYGLFH